MYKNLSISSAEKIPKSPLTEISGLKSQERFFTHFGRKLGVNWRKLWRKRRQFWDNQ
jgi:hypothetical protein